MTTASAVHAARQRCQCVPVSDTVTDGATVTRVRLSLESESVQERTRRVTHDPVRSHRFANLKTPQTPQSMARAFIFASFKFSRLLFLQKWIGSDLLIVLSTFAALSTVPAVQAVHSFGRGLRSNWAAPVEQ